MRRKDQEDLDEVANRLGNLYQAMGRLTPPGPISDPQWISALDEVVSITEEVERISGRAARESQ